MALITLDYRSQQLKRNVGVWLAVPDCRPDFTKPLSACRTVYLLHGLGDDCSAWVRYANAERYALERGLVLVMPSAGRSMYCNGVLGQNYFSYITEELPGYLHQIFGLSQRREQNFIMGLSMGGYGAARAALTYPDRYAAWGSLSGALDLTPILGRLDDTVRQEFPFLASHAQELDSTPLNPPNLLDSARHQGLPGYIACGLEDDLLLCTQRFQAASEALGLPNRFVYTPDRIHNWTYWEEQLPSFLDFVTEAAP